MKQITNVEECVLSTLKSAVSAQATVAVANLLSRFVVYLNSDVGNGCTLLHIACLNEDLPTAEILLKSGASPEIVDIDGNTALHLAVMG